MDLLRNLLENGIIRFSTFDWITFLIQTVKFNGCEYFYSLFFKQVKQLVKKYMVIPIWIIRLKNSLRSDNVYYSEKLKLKKTYENVLHLM